MILEHCEKLKKAQHFGPDRNRGGTRHYPAVVWHQCPSLEDLDHAPPSMTPKVCHLLRGPGSPHIFSLLTIPQILPPNSNYYTVNSYFYDEYNSFIWLFTLGNLSPRTRDQWHQKQGRKNSKSYDTRSLKITLQSPALHQSGGSKTSQ